MKVSSIFFVASLIVPVLVQAQADPAPVSLLLSSELSWDQPLEGDPLRVRVQLSSPAFESELMRQVQELEERATNLTPVVTRPLAATNWFESVSLQLFKVQTDGSRVLVLAKERWLAFLRPQVAGALTIEEQTLSRSREWLVPASACQLTSGGYSVEVSWDGRGKGVDAFLPVGGIMQAENLQFAVAARATPQEESVHLSRLAFEAYMEGNYAAARVHGQGAVAKRSDPPDPESLETHQIMASAALRMTNLFEAARSLQEMVRLTRGGGEIEEVALGQFAALAPELRLPPNYSAGQPLVLQLWAIPGQTYVVYSSSNLINWAAVSTNVPTTSPTEIRLEPGRLAEPEFYRVVWTR